MYFLLPFSQGKAGKLYFIISWKPYVLELVESNSIASNGEKHYKEVPHNINSDTTLHLKKAITVAEI